MKLDDETIDVLISGCLSKDHGLEPVRHRLSPCLERFQGQGDDLLGLLLGPPGVSTRALVDKPVRFQRDRGWPGVCARRSVPYASTEPGGNADDMAAPYRPQVCRPRRSPWDADLLGRRA